MFLVKLLAGDVKVMDRNTSSSMEEVCKNLLTPPHNEKTKSLYDTVMGTVDDEYNSKVYVVYENGRAYPEYLVRYYLGNRDPERSPFVSLEEARLHEKTKKENPDEHESTPSSTPSTVSMNGGDTEADAVEAQNASVTVSHVTNSPVAAVRDQQHLQHLQHQLPPPPLHQTPAPPLHQTPAPPQRQPPPQQQQLHQTPAPPPPQQQLHQPPAPPGRQRQPPPPQQQQQQQDAIILWEFHGNDGWISYDDLAQVEIEGAYQRNRTAKITIQGFPFRYELDLGKELQTNLDHPAHTSRKIRRNAIH
jgi:hypothetical protein